MANLVSLAAQACRTIAQRLVDAKGSGLAGRLDTLATGLFTLPGPARWGTTLVVALIGWEYVKAR